MDVNNNTTAAIAPPHHHQQQHSFEFATSASNERVNDPEPLVRHTKTSVHPDVVQRTVAALERIRAHPECRHAILFESIRGLFVFPEQGSKISSILDEYAECDPHSVRSLREHQSHQTPYSMDWYNPRAKPHGQEYMVFKVDEFERDLGYFLAFKVLQWRNHLSMRNMPTILRLCQELLGEHWISIFYMIYRLACPRGDLWTINNHVKQAVEEMCVAAYFSSSFYTIVGSGSMQHALGANFDALL
jgi:hypothetical protein